MEETRDVAALEARVAALEEVLERFLGELAGAQELVDVNIAAGSLLEERAALRSD